MSGQGHLRVGILLPCRNEERVIRRRIANLAQLHWPSDSGSNRVIVIDDHSTDATLELAREAMRHSSNDQFQMQVMCNEVRPGKNGAIEQGLLSLSGEVDLVFLTDADVLVEPGALLAVCAAFQSDELLGMACGSQVFVQVLDGTGACSGDLRSASAIWDRWTANVRRLESRFGKLFSVHGQWLAWRADLEISPKPGVAADDVDLMLQVRSGARPRVRMVPDARFYECKPAGGEAAESQGLRRARAWFQVFRPQSKPEGLRGLDRLQWFAYARVPAIFPWLCAGVILVGLLLVGKTLGWTFALGGLPLVVLLALTPFGREWLRTLRLIVQARRLERQEEMSEAWEMTREG
ncbi:MAG: cellulose synthase/poly-beta-1,6-N-acetylglucosamine synthase-like glycosyltransferase [Planctomycetota bacterium]|jgi:cellulose synthase/poly-beta-1,6-N-acetylglucosamine synthase-like glycosyltransferase